MSIQDEVVQIYHKIQKKVNHPYLNRYLPKPTVDIDKILTLFLLFKQHGSYKNIEQYVMSVMIAQMGLDTHEKITKNEEFKGLELKQRQLTVLSGDFYSSLYYYILAEQKDIQMIKWISQAIQELNMHKMHFFYAENVVNVDYYFNHLRQIESCLIIKLAEKLGINEWSDIIADFFFLKRLHLERDFLDHGEATHTSYIYHIIKGTDIDKQNFKEQIEDQMNQIRKKWSMDILPKKQNLSKHLGYLIDHFTKVSQPFKRNTLIKGRINYADR
ncbi:heptaprenyl diphosphate synthase component 1 [Terrilactibacillus laevilacticus]|uniref:heptaprenyl diphosphate synthase component 1 n=1 Tax=Terrilactibacillus laevilacticus TaxID=1380157 RepID=UPI0011474934|nr:heptaprenyl diphosphate synthase component 1 [Terrilactibacillus laevilacticus]